jgi:predicted amidophosphoribosyltransferase
MQTLLQTKIFKPFQCVSCETAIYYGSICDPCGDLFKYNDRILPAPAGDILGLAPLFYSVSVVHPIFKKWKGSPGLQTQRLLSSMHPDLRADLIDLQFDALVPIPQNAKRAWGFGHASAESAAGVFSKLLHLPILPALGLVQNNTTKKAAMSGRLDRQFSANPFFVKTEQPLKRILLVDDLVTTGSTLSKAADALMQYDSKIEIWAACLGYRPSLKTGD